MNEQNVIEQTDQQLAEAKRIRRERSRRRKKKITRHCCKQCGERKHYICLKCDSHKRFGIFIPLPKRIRYYSRKLYFSLAEKLRLIE